MSLWADARIKELLARVDALEKRLDEPEEEDNRTSMYLEELIHDYTKKFGKPPHHRMKLETIEEALK